MSESSRNFAPRCLSIDLEVGVEDSRIHRFAAVRGDDDASFVFANGDLQQALAGLDEFATGARFVLGHNIAAFDLAHLAAAMPGLRLLQLPVVDTLQLNPLAFPRNPYHHLVKHYQDGRISGGQRNDPELDARLALSVFKDQHDALLALRDSAPDLLTAWHWLTTRSGGGSGMSAFFTTLRHAPQPSQSEARAAIDRLLAGEACATQARAIIDQAALLGWPLAYALAWLSVAGGNSVMPPWVRHQYPAAGELVRRLRDTACAEPDCRWCRTHHDATRELRRWFGFDAFRAEPRDDNGHPLQQTIVEAAMAGRHVLGILPTGTGKSVCYQIPALSRHFKTGALTVVISPLVALMADQVAGLQARGIDCCLTINGMLSMPERADTLDRVRMGDAGIVILSPEQLRSRSVRQALAQREIGAWVLDEAHCLSRWGQDFRPDYRYVARFIREKAAAGPVPPILCLTATAKPDVVTDIVQHFRERVGIELLVLDGGASRSNLDFVVVPSTQAEKFAHVHQVLMADLPPEQPGGAIVYCASRRTTEELAAFLRDKGLAAAHFHAGMQPETKKSTQTAFVRGELRVIVATNAFGMGIDKPDVRLVIHADVPGSLENYLQEAGRAGRDRAAARCVLLYAPDDVERQFGLSARSRLTRAEIHGILRALRRLDRNKRMHGEVVATTGEILAFDEDDSFQRDERTDDTRVRTAVAWLEEAELLTREENRVQVFPSSLRVNSLQEAQNRLARTGLTEDYRRRLLALVGALIDASADDGVSTDELMGVTGLSPEGVRKALHDLEALGLASNDLVLTAFVHVGVEHSSRKRLELAAALETAMIAELRVAAPDLGKNTATTLNLRILAQHLKDGGHPGALPEYLLRLLRGLEQDGRDEDGGAGSLRLRKHDPENFHLSLQREWPALEKTANLRRAAAERVLAHLLASLPADTRGTDKLAETTLGRLQTAIDADLALKAEMKNARKLLERSLMWLHEQEVIRLNKGLAVFRPAMTIRLGNSGGGFRNEDFKPLRLHYEEQVRQIHVMAEYAQRGLKAIAEALQLAMDYFSLPQAEFLQRWLPRRDKEIARQTTPESWQAIVDALDNRFQQGIVADGRDNTNVLVLAGPGAGKTRVLVHRIAYLIRVRRERARGILALAYNRHAAVEIRRRLADLIGDDARGVTVMTCHAFAMRLTGASFERQAAAADNASFRNVLCDALALLRGEGLPTEEADDLRTRLLAGFRWILVDEYQDVGADQYALISALTGRTLADEDGRLNLFAVGDDDQNIYAFSGASVEFIRRFEQDYKAQPVFLTENYRSSAHLIAAANRIIAAAGTRMKADHPISIDRARQHSEPGGRWAALDPVSRGRVQVLPVGTDLLHQAMLVMVELERLAALDAAWDWSRVAVIAREWKYLVPVRTYCEAHGIAVQMADEDGLPLWRLRETQALVEWVHGRPSPLLTAAELQIWLAAQANGTWWDLLREAADTYAQETGGSELPAAHFIDWLAEWTRDARRRQTGLLLLTAHRAKGLEFDHVAILDGAWHRVGNMEDVDAPRRLYYVAMTRARQTLLLARFAGAQPLLDALVGEPAVLLRDPPSLAAVPDLMRRRHVRVGLGEVDLGFAGRHRASDPIHEALAALTPGAELSLLRRESGSHELVDRAGHRVGRMARSFTLSQDECCCAARVAAILTRRREDTPPEYQQGLRCERWEVVVPELVLAPAPA